MQTNQAVLVLEDGSVFYGRPAGISGYAVGEVVFNTAMTGYQEILTDPSYTKQLVTLTYPHIGNTGTNSHDAEAEHCYASGLIIRNLSIVTSNWRNEQSLEQYLQAKSCVAIADIDTRALTRLLREQGALKGCILADRNTDKEVDITLGKQRLAEFSGLAGLDLARTVSTNKAYQWTSKSWSLTHDVTVADQSNDFHIVVYDFGVKRNILRLLADRGCRITVVPAMTTAAAVQDLQPDGVLLSNGPGDPEPCVYAINAIRELLAANLPLFGICLGHQLLALACGAKTSKMKYGHHGANHPVQDLASRRIFITSQNHGFAVDEASLPANVQATHRSLFDGSLQGIRCVDKPAFGFQGHPEASPGPHDIAGLFDDFMALIAEYKHHA